MLNVRQLKPFLHNCTDMYSFVLRFTPTEMYLMVLSLSHDKLLMDTVALQRRKNGYSLFMASWLSWERPVPKLGKTRVQTILHTLTLTLTYQSCCVYSSLFLLRGFKL